MLVLITNRCHSGCTHCMQDSRPDGPLMSEVTFERALRLCQLWQNQVLVISGGEPFEHPKLFDFCKRASDLGILFTICTNGLWLGDEKKRYSLEKISSLKEFAGAQMYSNPKWYPHHEEAVDLWKNYGSWAVKHGLQVEPADIRGMIPLGRAANNEKALEEVARSPYHMSCLKGYLTAVQVKGPISFIYQMNQHASFCKPVIDWFGNIRMSESVCCPVISDLSKDSIDIWEDICKSRPCYQCSLAKKFLEEAKMMPNSKIGIAARFLNSPLEEVHA